MDQVHVVRHKVLVEGGASGRWPGSWALSRTTVGRTSQTGPVRDGGRASAATGLGQGAERAQGLLPRRPMDGRQAAADGDATARDVRAEGHEVGVTLVKEAVAEWKRRRREVFVPLTYRRATRRGGLLRGAGRSRRDAPQGVAVPDAADVTRAATSRGSTSGRIRSTIVVPALIAALATGTPLLLALTPAPPSIPRLAPDDVPAPLRAIEVGCGSAADYDAWLGRLWYERGADARPHRRPDAGPQAAGHRAYVKGSPGKHATPTGRTKTICTKS